MTYKETIDVINARQRRYKEELQSQAVLTYKLADFIASSVGRLFEKRNNYPNLNEVFPGLFNDIEEKPKQQDWRIIKERINAIAAARKRGGKP